VAGGGFGGSGLSARTAESKSVGDLAISGFGKSWRELAIEYNLHADRHVVSYAGGLSISDKDRQEDDTDRVQPAFTRTLFRNPLVPNAATGIRRAAHELLKRSSWI